MKNKQYRNRLGRKPALNHIGMAVVATMIAGGAHAADTSYNFDGGGAVVNAGGHQVQNLLLNNTGVVNATLQNGQGNIGANGSQTANSTFLTGNTMGASAVGNLAAPVSTSIDLSLISDTGGGNTGLATLLHSTNTGAVSSLVEDNGLSIVLTGFESGSAVNQDNTISASTVANQGTSSIAGAVPIGYTSITPGSASVSSLMGPVESAATGSIVVTTAQQTSGVGASAVAADNAVALTLTADILADALEAGAAVSGNKIIASTKGNSSASTIDIQTVEGAPTFAGSAVVSNTQLGTNAPATAINSNGSVRATVTGVDGTSQLGGSLAVSGNSISSATIGNEALGSGTSPVGNQILLADGLSFAGPGGVTPGSTLNGYADGTAVNADLVIANTQSNTSLLGSVMGSSTLNGAVEASVESLVNGAVALSDNSISASATGNAARSALASGTNAASFAGSAALANQQDNTTVGVTAVNAGSSIEASAGAVQNSSVSVADNRSSASARGNEVGQSLSLDATTLTLGGTAELIAQEGLFQANGMATVSNRQVNSGTAVGASNTASSIGQSAVTATGPTLSVTGNTQDAVALANNASNQLTLAGTTVSGGAGILSQQRVDAEDADVTPASTVTATLGGARAFIEAGSLGGSVSGSTLAVTDNLQEAIGYGNLVNNAMSVVGTTLVTPDTLGAASTVAFDINDTVPFGNVAAAFGVLSQQSVLSDVRASALSSGASAEVAVTGSLDNSTARNDDNTVSTEAYGNYGQSGLSLNATNLGVGTFSNVGNLTSLQSVDASITAEAATGAVALTSVSGNVGSVDTVSSVSASGNRIDAQATGSRAINTVGASATNIDTVATSALGTSADVASTTNAAFSLQNMQTGAGSVNARLLDADDTSLPSDVRVGIAGNVTRSSVVADGNTARAAATSNNASNAVTVDASGSLASSSALQNVQVTSAGVNALVGQAGLAASAGGPFNYGIGGTGLSHDSETNMFTAGTLTVDTTALSAEARAFLLDNGWSVAGGNMLSRSAVGYSATAVDYLDLTLGGTFARSGVTLPTDGTPNFGGVNLAVGGTVIDSALSVSGNTTYGLTRGNVATNRTEVKGNAIASGSTSDVASAGADFMGDGLETVGDHTVANLQQAMGATIDSNVYGSFFIETQPGAAITGSSLSVSGNTQMAEARANTATSSLMLEGTGVTAVSALQSAQMSSSAVNASSNLNLFAPGAVTNTSVLLSNNSNIALAVMNDATNTVTVKASQAGTGQIADISVGGSFGDTLAAEHVLANQQVASSAVTSTASTTLNNQEALVSDTGVAVGSTLSILGNTTAAEATANQALNTASVTGTASQGASVGVRNMQDSSADVTASATSAARVSLAPLASTALNNSSVALDGNSTTALARGNTASNVLNSLAGANYGAASGGSVQSGDVLTGFAVNANAGILNSQFNEGAVSASSTAASYQVALNSGLGGAATASGMAVTGNQVAAQAYGNSAVNQLTLNALNTGTPTSAIGNYQRNSGAITATVTSVSFGAGITGAMAGNTVNLSGNQISASAVGNSVASSIMAAPR